MDRAQPPPTAQIKTKLTPAVNDQERDRYPAERLHHGTAPAGRSPAVAEWTGQERTDEPRVMVLGAGQRSIIGAKGRSA